MVVVVVITVVVVGGWVVVGRGRAVVRLEASGAWNAFTPSSLFPLNEEERSFSRWDMNEKCESRVTISSLTRRSTEIRVGVINIFSRNLGELLNVNPPLTSHSLGGGRHSIGE